MSLLYFPSSNAGALTFISKSTVTGTPSSVDITGIDSTYNIYLVQWFGINFVSGGGITFQASTDGGTSFGVSGRSVFTGGAISDDNATTYWQVWTGNDIYDSTDYALISAAGDEDGEELGCGELYLYNPAGSEYTYFKSSAGGRSGSGAITNYHVTGVFQTSSAIDAISFGGEGSASYEAGTFSLYGIKTS